MAQHLQLDIQGQKTHPNPIQAGQGALRTADNVVIDAPNVASSRRGFTQWNAQITNPTDRINGFVNYDSKIIMSFGDVLTVDDGAGAWTDYSEPVAAPSATMRTHFAIQNGCLYMTTDEGVKKLDGAGSAISYAGMVRGIGGNWSLIGGPSGFLAQAQVAYRFVWGIKDAKDNVIIGPPSQRMEVTGPGAGSDDVAIAILIPAGITTSHFVQVYRSAPSAGLTEPANDEMALVYEASPTAGEITAGYVGLNDRTPDNLRGATIYTAPSQEGILQENERPPLCKDIELYKDMTVFANTETRHRIFITLMGAGGASGVQIGDVITLAGDAYTGAAAENVAAAEFQVFSTGNPGDDIMNTSNSFCKVVNGYASNAEVYAYYISAYDDLPGKMMIEARNFAFSYTMQASANGTAWSPALDVAQSSDNETKKNRIYFSKNSQPEAVPILNYVDVGSDESEILRIKTLRDSLFVFTSKGECYKVTGETAADMTVNLFDSNVSLKGSETVAVVNNQIYLYTVQGVQAVTEAGAGVVSWDNDALFQQFASATVFPNFEEDAFGVGYDNDRKYILYNTDSVYVYNVFTKAWTRWTLDFTAGFANSDNRLYFGKDTGYVYQERKDLTATDYADDSVAVTITGASGYVVTLSDLTGVVVGWSLLKGTTWARIESINAPANQITLSTARAWSNGAATVNKPILCEVEWNPIHCGNPGIKKQFTDIQPMFRALAAGSVMLTFRSNFSQNAESVDVESSTTTNYAYNTFPYNTLSPFGGTSYDENDSVALRTLFPLEKQVALWERVKVSTEEAFTSFQLLGISIQYTPMDWGFK